MSNRTKAVLAAVAVCLGLLLVHHHSAPAAAPTATSADIATYTPTDAPSGGNTAACSAALTTAIAAVWNTSATTIHTPAACNGLSQDQVNALVQPILINDASNMMGNAANQGLNQVGAGS